MSKSILKGINVKEPNVELTLQGKKYIKTVGGITLFVLCISSDDALYFTKIPGNISEGFRVIEQT